MAINNEQNEYINNRLQLLEDTKKYLLTGLMPEDLEAQIQIGALFDNFQEATGKYGNDFIISDFLFWINNAQDNLVDEIIE